MWVPCVRALLEMARLCGEDVEDINRKASARLGQAGFLGAERFLVRFEVRSKAVCGGGCLAGGGGIAQTYTCKCAGQGAERWDELSAFGAQSRRSRYE